MKASPQEGMFNLGRGWGEGGGGEMKYRVRALNKGNACAHT